MMELVPLLEEEETPELSLSPHEHMEKSLMSTQ